MDYFLYKGDELYAEEVAVSDIAKQYGTPCYIYSQQTLERHWHAVNDVFGKAPHRICYAVKANGNLALLKILVDLGAGFDIVSGGELARVLAAGASPQKIVFSGVGKTAAEIQQALSAGIAVFNVESISEIHRINAIALAMGKVASVAIRINPDIKADTHPYISTGLASNKFGIDKNEVIAAYKTIQRLPGLKAVGMACHIGSQILELAPFEEALSCVLQLVTELKTQDIILQHVDIGGGLGVCYDAEAPPSLEAYANNLLKILKQQAPYPLELWLEPGRVIVANTAILVARVEYLKETATKTFAILDAGMTDLMRPALYDAHHKIIAVKKTAQTEILVDLVGPVCESSDFLGKARRLAIQPGDLIAVRTVGAYGFSMSSQYNARGRAAEVLVNKDKMTLIRRRETAADLLAHEQKRSFMKMQALGNDFVLLDLNENPAMWTKEEILQYSNRYTGIGFDQLLTIKKQGENEFDYHIYNADGGEVEQCGNGARAVALYLCMKNKVDITKDILLKTCNRIMTIQLLGDNRFKVDMGHPDFSPQALPLEMPEQNSYEIILEGETHRFAALSMGNPHAVLQVSVVENAPVATVGKALCLHSRFPRQTNVGFMQIVNDHRLVLRVYERGVGETLACGSGACAAAVIAIRDGYCHSPVKVQLPGGELLIYWSGSSESVWMEGTAHCVYEGFI
ncbi:MAG: diaminopimelate decarboxylase [Gammaproteobacteria bacterium]|nr:diaminopimelate decarboxylase [Gammaproteobacteria bacterium]